jgi:hypothetical protein
MIPQSLKLICASACIILSAAPVSNAQTTPGQISSTRTAEWPKTINTATGTILHLFSPHILSYEGDSIQYRSVISVQGTPDGEPVFGVAWATAKVVADPDGKVLTIEAVRVDRLSIPGDNDKVDHDLLSYALSVNTPRVVKTMTVAEVQSSLRLGQQEAVLANDAGGVSTKVYFATEPTALVLIDGEPQLTKNERWGLDFVKNTRNLIVQDKDGKFYLYGAGYWYTGPTATGPYSCYYGNVSHTLSKIERDLAKAARKSDVPFGDAEEEMTHIVVSTVPAVLVQSEGQPVGKPLPYSTLYYVSNSNNAIYYDTVSKHFYVQSGGNWFQSDSLHNPGRWQAVSRADLPSELLVSLNGWEWGDEGPAAGREAKRKDLQVKAVMEQQVPQTARVDRTITTSVDYDGAPQFAPIEGTVLEYATNTCSIVLKFNAEYYALDNGIWFIAGSPLGAWRVSDVRPDGVELISRKYRVYRAKFVYIYQTTPTAVYEGYLPGYEEAPVDGCGMAVAYDQEWSNMAWSYDLDYVFDWGFGWLDGYYRYDPWNVYYGCMIYGGSHPGWKWKAYGPSTKNGGGAPGGGSVGGYAENRKPGAGPHGGPPVGAVPGTGYGAKAGLTPHPPGGWGQRTQNIGYSGVVVTMPNRPGMPQVTGGPSGNVSGLRGLPSGGSSALVGNTGAPVSRGGGGYSGGVRSVTPGAGSVRGYSGGGSPGTAVSRSGGGYSGGGAVRSSYSGGGNSSGARVSSVGGGYSGGGGGGVSHAGSGGSSSPGGAVGGGSPAGGGSASGGSTGGAGTHH